MVSRGFGRIALAAAILAASPSAAYAQDDHAAVPTELVELVVEAGRPLRVALDERVNVKRVGQPVEGTLIDPLYSYDRAVVPAGTKVRGHVTALEPFTKKETVESFAAGQFGPRNRVVVGFDALEFDEGRVVPIHTAVNRSAERLTISAAPDEAPGRGGDHDQTGIVDQGREAVAQARRDALRNAHAALDAIKQPAKMDRAKAEIVSDRHTGLHFTPGDAADLAAKVEWAWSHPRETEVMGRAARAEYEAKYTAERNYEMLMQIYLDSIERHAARPPA